MIQEVDHPLIDGDRTYYINEEGRTTIEEIEEKLTLVEMIGAVKFNIMKYESRRGKKDVDGEEEQKIKRYSQYLEYLEAVPSKYALYYTKIALFMGDIRLKYPKANNEPQ